MEMLPDDYSYLLLTNSEDASLAGLSTEIALVTENQ